MVMTILLVATGFSAACFLLYWSRWVYRKFAPPLSLGIHFSPKGGCADVVVNAINAAKNQILVMAYSFTYDPIVKALMEAHARGLDVELIFDKSNEADLRSDMPRCIEKKMKVLVDAEHAIAHNKVMIIDQKVVITGSFNFTRQAEDANAENLIVIRNDRGIAEKYLQYYENHKVHSRAPQLKPGAGSMESSKQQQPGDHYRRAA
jgi:phosphatidylserine/phosphatidylglycerophosphate/cardiolipin synthase-like enzyme